jgi:hypothetical protein
MKSRRRIVCPRLRTAPTYVQLQQGFAIGGMGFDGQFALQKS